MLRRIERQPRPVPPEADLPERGAGRFRAAARRRCRAALGRLALILGLAVPAGPAVAERCADVGLVFAIDASGSITDADFHLQTAGHYAALHHPRVLSALAEAGVVDLAAVFWASGATPPQVVGWRRIGGADDARAFARELVATERRVSGNTDIGAGIEAALDLFEKPGRCADRPIIDLSGDGKAVSTGRSPGADRLARARQRAADMGVTINALAITRGTADLAAYYENHVATGAFSFVMEAADFDAFAEALARKMARELIAGVARTGP